VFEAIVAVAAVACKVRRVHRLCVCKGMKAREDRGRVYVCVCACKKEGGCVQNKKGTKRRVVV